MTPAQPLSLIEALGKLFKSAVPGLAELAGDDGEAGTMATELDNGVSQLRLAYRELQQVQKCDAGDLALEDAEYFALLERALTRLAGGVATRDRLMALLAGKAEA